MKKDLNILQVSVLNYSEMLSKVYNGGGLIDPTIFDRIRYFSRDDFDWLQKDLKPFYVVLTLDSKIIGLVKCTYYEMDALHEKNFSLSFFSIDMQYRNFGYSRLMADKLFEYASVNGIELNTSTYTYLGKLKLQKIMLEMALKYNVVFNDKKDTDHLNDGEWIYDKNLIHQNEKKRYDMLCLQGVDLKLTKHPEYIETNKELVEGIMNRDFSIRGK